MKAHFMCVEGRGRKRRKDWVVKGISEKAERTLFRKHGYKQVRNY